MSGESIECGTPGVLKGIDDGGLEGIAHYGQRRQEPFGGTPASGKPGRRCAPAGQLHGVTIEGFAQGYSPRNIHPHQGDKT